MCCSELRCVAVCCSVLQVTSSCSSSGYGPYDFPVFKRCVAVSCSELQCVAARCSMLQYVAVCCSVLQCVAACCSVLQCQHRLRLMATCDTTSLIVSSTSRFLVCCGGLWCVAVVSGSVLQCVAGCCSVLQCVAVCCSASWYRLR